MDIFSPLHVVASFIWTPLGFVFGALGGALSALLWWRRHGVESRGAYWEVIYVEDSGQMLFTNIRIIAVDNGLRRVTAWCEASGRERRFKVRCLISARDMETGAKVNIQRWLLAHRSLRAPLSNHLPGRRSVPT